MSNNKKYWKGVEELKDTPSFQEVKNKEFSEYLPAEDFLADDNVIENSSTSRRDFLKYLGFGVTAASLAACETPVNRVIPYVTKTDKTHPGVANYFATTYFDGTDYRDVLVKTREGRPIHINGNTESPLAGVANARVNSSVLSLYDSNRLKAPSIDGEEVSWTKFLDGVKTELAKGGKVRLVSTTIISPSTKHLIDEFIAANEGSDIELIQYDEVSASSFLEANKESFGKRHLHSYDLSKAKSVVCVGADFMNAYPSAQDLTVQYAATRKPENGWMSKHFQFESSLSLTGSNADVRVPVKPTEQGKVVAELYNYIASKTGNATVSASKTAYTEKVKQAAEHLLSNKGKSIVLAGANNKAIQLLVNGINTMLDNYGSTLDINNGALVRRGDDIKFSTLIKEMSSVSTLIVLNGNPAYTSSAFAEAMKKAKSSVVFSVRPNETTANAKYIGALPHYLEAWNDANPTKENYSISQAVINPLFNTMQYQDCLLKLANIDMTFYDYMRSMWEKYAFSGQTKFMLFDDMWNSVVHDGFYINPSPMEEEAPTGFAGDVNAAASSVAKANTAEWELEFYQKVGIGTGNQAHNPWLQELPDPISKITWDNYVCMNPTDAREQGFATEYGEQKNAHTVNLTVNGIAYDNVPVVAQPGQARGTLSVALGYGQTMGKSNQMVVGFNAYSAIKNSENIDYCSTDVSFEATGEDYQIATTQTHQTIMGRDSVVRETSLDVFLKGNVEEFNPPHMLATHDGPKSINDVDLWASHPVENVGHHWGMSIDLNSCFGCGSCVTSCNSENNVPVVGKDEVRRSREMHWLRIDRYFSSEEERLSEDERSYGKMEIAEDNPMVVHQPMMCQHCNHAPCETVCPVAATTHSNEGLNQMTYNRCIGTRYCANNCPYKVRRFNWFNYIGLGRFEEINPSQDDLGRMVLNPDVTVRARGVMEKCSMCVQRIQTGKLNAKKEGRAVTDGEIQTACSSACPTNAITFGDLNDKNSMVRKGADSSRSYRVIEEVGTQPNIYYQVKVRNTESNIA